MLAKNPLTWQIALFFPITPLLLTFRPAPSLSSFFHHKLAANSPVSVCLLLGHQILGFSFLVSPFEMLLQGVEMVSNWPMQAANRRRTIAPKFSTESKRCWRSEWCCTTDGVWCRVVPPLGGRDPPPEWAARAKDSRCQNFIQLLENPIPPPPELHSVTKNPDHSTKGRARNNWTLQCKINLDNW